MEDSVQGLGPSDRQVMAGIFEKLFVFKKKQKAKWARLLRLRVLIGRMKLNRILLQWKV